LLTIYVALLDAPFATPRGCSTRLCTVLNHLRAATNVEVVRKWRTVTSHAERYLAKGKNFPKVCRRGRVWGRWNADLLPIQWGTVQVSLKDAYRIRRVFRKLAEIESTASVLRPTIFVSHENVVRLLEYLGYQLSSHFSVLQRC
jgi:hypothetical protein